MLKRADWVTTKHGGRGIVRRVAKSGSWADVTWYAAENYNYSKRMPAHALIVLYTIRGVI